MKKLSLLTLITLTSLYVTAQEPVTVGKGSYAAYAPLAKSKTDEHGGDQSKYMQYRNLYIVEEAGVPIPTNDWWTDLINGDRGRSGREVTGHLWSYPQYVQGMKYGIDVHYPKYWVDNGTEMKAQSKLLVKGGNTFNATTPLAEKWSDWTVTFSETSGTQKMTTTLAHGVPFTWIELTDIEPVISVVKTGNDGADNKLTGSISVSFAVFSGIIANQASNLVKALPFFQAELTATQRVAAFIAGNAKILGAGLAAVGMVVSLAMTYHDGEKAKERDKERLKAMEEIRSNFDKATKNICEQMQSNVKQWMEATITPIINSFDEKIKDTESQMTSEKTKSEKLSTLLKRTENLISEIQTCK